MDLRKLLTVNLNLLPALDALLSERSVSRAALRLSITQPAMSQSLRQLREIFADSLLVRQGSTMILTPRAERIAALLRPVLRDIDHLLAHDAGFDPAAAERVFVLGARDYVASLLLGPLVERLAALAPRVCIRISSRLSAEALVSGKLDLAVAPPAIRTWQNTAGLLVRQLYTDAMVCVVRSGHPILTGMTGGAGALDLERFVSAAHVQVSPGRDMKAPEDMALARLGTTRQIALSVPYFSAALAAVARSDLMAVLPRRCVLPHAAALSLVLLEPPPALPLPPIAMAQIWHSRNHEDLAHIWLREQIAACAAEMP